MLNIAFYFNVCLIKIVLRFINNLKDNELYQANVRMSFYKYILNVVPSPTSLLTSILPPMAST